MGSENGVPSGWREASIDSICDLRRGASPRPIGDPRWFADKGPGWVRIVDVTRSRRYLRRTKQSLSKLGASKSVRVKPGDVIMSICATIGCPVIVDMDACIHDGFVFFDNLSEDVDPEYLCNLLERETARFSGQGQKGTQGNLNTSIVKSARLLLPPRVEQHRIVNVLASIDDAIEGTRAVIDQTRKLKTALLQDLLTNGLPGRHSEFKRDFRLGRVPVDWKISQIQENAEVTQGIALGPHRKPRRNATPYLRVANVQMGFVDSNEIKYIEASDEEQTKYALRTGDVLVVEGHANIEDLGRAALVPLSVEGMVFQNHLFRIRTNPDHLDTRYLAFWINSPPGRAYFRIFGGTTSGLNTVGSSQIRTLRLPLPSVKEQHRICGVVESIDYRIRMLVDDLTQLHELKSALSQALLTGHVRVPSTSEKQQ